MEHSTSVSQRLTAILLCICLLMSLIPFSAPRGYASRDDRSLIGEIGGYLHGSLQTIQKTYAERKFTAAQGHGFAAERANNLFDILHGEKAVIIGDNNAKNGADRKIINRDGTTTYIQDKYYSTASGSVNAAFDTVTGEYRYLTSDGTAMWLEVPYDQYDDALQLMQKKISDGKVPGVSDPSEAANYVRQGKYTYKQAQNIVKAGNIDSLKYDATNGIITAIGSFGISFALDFVSCKMNGESFKDATKNAALNGLKTGGFVFATYVISSQLAKAGLRSALKPTTDAIANALGNGVSSAILGAFGENASALTASQIAAKVSAILQNQIITSGVIVVALSASDVVDLFCGRISKEQLLKNLIVFSPIHLFRLYTFFIKQTNHLPEILSDLPAQMVRLVLQERRRNFIPPVTLSEVRLDDDILFADFMLKWLEIAKSSIQITTYASYQGMVERVIAPYFRKRGIKLVDLKATDLQDFYTKQLERVKANSVIHYHANIHKALKYAVKIDLIPTNPADKVERPKKNEFKGNYYSAEEIHALSEIAQGTKLEIPVLLASFYGLRRSEVLGLKWDAIDFEENTLEVKHIVTQASIDGKKVLIQADRAKTKSSLRTLPLVPPIRDRLLTLKGEQETYRRLCGKCYNNDYLGYLCVDEVGNIIRPNYVSEQFPKLLKSNGLRAIRFHDLRHSCASLLLANGVPMKQIQEWLGHSNFSTTANIYAHLDYTSKLSSAQAMLEGLGYGNASA